MDKKNVQFSFSQKSFAKFIVVFLDESEKRECNYYFCNEYIYGNKNIIFMFLFNLSVKKE